MGQLYKDDHFVSSLYNALTSEGVFVVQVGEADELEDAGDNFGPGRVVYDFVSIRLFSCVVILVLFQSHMSLQMEALQHTGFESIHSYEDFHSKVSVTSLPQY